MEVGNHIWYNSTVNKLLWVSRYKMCTTMQFVLARTNSLTNVFLFQIHGTSYNQITASANIAQLFP